MSRAATILLLLLALGTALFLTLVEPRWKSTRQAAATREYVLNFNPAGVTGILITAGDDGFRLERQGGDWWIGPKPRDVASPKMVSQLLESAARLRIFDVIRGDELPKGRDLDDFGLAKPKSQFDLIGDGEPALYFGKEAAGDGRIYVRRADSDDIFVVSDELQRLAFRSAQDFRDRRLTNLTPDRIESFSIRRAGGEIAFERGAQGWEIVRPLRAKADAAAVDQLLATMLGLPILDFLADESDDLSAYGLGEPRAELVLQIENEGRPIALRIGADADAAGTKAVLAQFTARDSVYHLPAKAWNLLQVGPDDLRDRQLLGLNLDTVDAIRLRDGAKSWTLLRDGEGWKSGERTVKSGVVEQVVKNLTGAVVRRYLPPTAENLQRAGLDHPVGEIAFDALLSENTPEMAAGRRTVARVTIGAREGANVYVRVDDHPEIGLIPASSLEGVGGSSPLLGP